MLLGMTSNRTAFNHFVGLEREHTTEDRWQIRLNGGKLGNIHGPEDSPEAFRYFLSVCFAGEESCQVHVKCTIYKRIHEVPHTVAELEKELSLEPGTAAGFEMDYRPYIDSFAVYYTDVKVYGEEPYPVASQTFSLSYVRLPKEQDMRFGADIHMGAQLRNRDMLKLAAQCGLKFLRADVTWTDIEKTPGVHEFPQWYDDYVDAALECNIEPMLLFAYCNGLHDGGFTPHTEEGIQAYADFCAACVKHFKGRVKYYEVWNEYNFFGPFNNGGEPPETYARMVIAAVRAMKAVDSDIKIVACSTCGGHFEWLKRVIDGGALPYIDILSPHPYSAIPSAAFADDGKGQMLAVSNEFRRLSIEAGDEKPVWMTEVGWSCQRDVSGLTREQQAAAAVRAFVLTTTMKPNDKIFWYDFVNDDLNQYDRENNWGFVEARNASVNYAAKEAYLAVSTLNDKLANAAFLQEYALGSHTRAFLLEKAGKKVLVFWSLAEEETITLCTDGGRTVLTDLSGNETQMTALNGKVTVSSTVYPQYLEGVTVKEEKAVLRLASDGVECVPGEYAQIELIRSIEGGEYQLLLPPDWEATIQYSDDGRDRICLSVPATADKQPYRVDLSYKTGDGVAAAFSVVVTVVPKLSLTVKPFMGENGWQLLADVKNASKREHIKGRLRITEPAEWRLADKNAVHVDRRSSSAIVHVHAGTTEKVLFEAPETLDDRSYVISMELLLDNGEVNHSYHRINFLGVPRRKEKPVIDGRVTEEKWGRPLIVLTEKDFVPFEGHTVQSGLKAELFLNWDDENLYIAAKVFDKVHFQDCTTGDRWQDLWDGDGIQMLFDPIRETRTSRECYNELCFARTSTTGEELVWRFRTIFNRGVHRMQTPKRAIRRDGEVTLYEIAMPWQEILPDGMKPEAGKDYGIAFGVNDNNGEGFTGRMLYYGGIGAWFDNEGYDPALAGDMVLLP